MLRASQNGGNSASVKVFAVNTLDRLKQELQETLSLLASPRVNTTTRYVLERLRDDLENRISQLEAERAATAKD